MKRLINGMFSSIPDAEFMMKTLDENSIDVESHVQTDADDKPAKPAPPEMDSNI